MTKSCPIVTVVLLHLFGRGGCAYGWIMCARHQADRRRACHARGGVRSASSWEAGGSRPQARRRRGARAGCGSRQLGACVRVTCRPGSGGAHCNDFTEGLSSPVKGEVKIHSRKHPSAVGARGSALWGRRQWSAAPVPAVAAGTAIGRVTGATPEDSDRTDPFKNVGRRQVPGHAAVIDETTEGRALQRMARFGGEVLHMRLRQQVEEQLCLAQHPRLLQAHDRGTEVNGLQTREGPELLTHLEIGITS